MADLIGGLIARLAGGAGRRYSPAAPPRRGYAVCGAPRSGSNYFCEVLSSTGRLGHPREYFNAAARRAVDGDPGYPDDPKLQVARILSQGATANGVYALKLFPGLFESVAPHLRLTEALPGLRFVRLRRGDALGQAISWVRSMQTGQYRSSEQRQAEPAYDGALIRTYLGQVCQRAARWDMYFARTGITPVEVAYEDLVRDPQAAVDRVAEAMDVVPRPLVDLERVGLRMQRDDISRDWRERFHAEHGDPNSIDPMQAMVASL